MVLIFINHKSWVGNTDRYLLAVCGMPVYAIKILIKIVYSYVQCTYNIIVLLIKNLSKSLINVNSYDYWWYNLEWKK